MKFVFWIIQDTSLYQLTFSLESSPTQNRDDIRLGVFYTGCWTAALRALAQLRVSTPPIASEKETSVYVLYEKVYTSKGYEVSCYSSASVGTTSWYFPVRFRSTRTHFWKIEIVQ